MSDYINTGAYLQALADDLVLNLHQQLEKKGFAEIRSSHGWIFHYIADTGSRITDLASKAKITKQSMSVIVYQLEAWGYLERKPDPTDKRAVLFVLTGKGQELRKVGRAINKDFEQVWEQKLGRDDFQRFRQYLHTLYTHQTDT